MKEYKLKYGCNPNQVPARIHADGRELPFEILNGRAGYINFLDALNAWQLVRELQDATGLPAAASFKHVSPAGAAVASPLDEIERAVCFADPNEELTPLATAYIRARGCDRVSSFGDFAALSCECDECTARFLQREVSDGIIAPSYSEGALEILKKKKRGNYLIIQIDPNYEPAPIETKEVFGIKFEQKRNDAKITTDLFENAINKWDEFPESAKQDLLVATLTLKYTQSNSVCYAVNGQTIGVGAGQQSRINCTQLAGNKADKWFLRHHEKVLTLPFIDDIRKCDADNAVDLYITDSAELIRGDLWKKYFTKRPKEFTEGEKFVWHQQMDNISLSSDAFFPFEDNIERAAQSGVKYIAQPGGSVRDMDVTRRCRDLDIKMAMTGIRLFHH